VTFWFQNELVTKMAKSNLG